MPNWCENTLTLSHKDPAMIERAKAAFVKGNLLNEFIPCPQDLIDTVSGYVPEQEALDAKQAINRAKYGFSTWYEHNITKWGTKWDVGSPNGIVEVTENTISLSFESAWAPPVSAYHELEELGFTVKAMYHEPGMGFGGIFKDGWEEYFEWEGDTSEELAARLPVELNEAFSITENMAAWEAENEGDE